MTQSRSVVVRLSAETSQYIREMQRAGKLGDDAMRKVEKGTRNSSAALDDLGGKAGKVGLVAGAAFTGIVASAANFDEAMSHVAATGEDARGSLEALRKEALEAGARTKFSATEAAQGIEELSKAGLSARDTLTGGLDGALDLAASGQLAVADAAEITATALTQFQLKGDQATHVADLLAAGAGKAQGEVADMALALKYAGVPAANLGVSIEETAGTIALFAKNGIIGEQAGTSLRGMIASLSSPSETAAETMKGLGISVFDARGEFVGLDGVAEQLQSRLSGLTQEERANALGRIFGNEQLQAANVLYREGSEGVRKWTAEVDDSGYAAESAATKMDNLKGDVELLTGALQTAFIGAGADAQGPLRELTQGLTGVVDQFNEMPQAGQSAVTAILGVTSVLGLGTYGGASLSRGIRNTREELATLKTSMSELDHKMVATRASAGLAGAGLFTLTAATEKGGKGFDLLGNAAGGALTGFAVGGPWGAAIGGTVGALGTLAVQAGKTTDKLVDDTPKIEDWAAAFERSAGAIDATVRRLALKELQGSEDWDFIKTVAEKNDIAMRDIVSASLGQKGAQDRILKALGGPATQAERDQQALLTAQFAGTGLPTPVVNTADQFLKTITGGDFSRVKELAQAGREAAAATTTWADALEGLPKEVFVALRNENFQMTYKEVLALGEQYELTPREVSTILRALNVPRTVGEIDGVRKKADELASKRPVVKVDADITPAERAVRRLQRIIDGLHGKSVEVTATYRNVLSGEYDYYGNKRNPADGGTIPHGGGSPIRAAAMGATVPDDGGPYNDRFPYLLAPLEEVVSNRRGQADEFRTELKAINAGASRREVFEMLAGRLADGGSVLRGGTSYGMGAMTTSDFARYQDASTYRAVSTAPAGGIDYDRLASALRGIRPVADTINVQPHDYRVFERQMNHLRRLSGSDGARASY